MTSTLDRQQERFRANPGDAQVFEALEEHYFLNSEWGDLIALYEHRLNARAIQKNPRARAQVLFRMAQVWSERMEDAGRAAACYERVLQADPQFRPAFRELRQIHAARGQWEVALQIGEAEAALAMRPDERAELLSVLGSIWLERVGDSEQALAQFERALAEQPEREDALEGTARALEACGRPREAAAAWEQLIARLSGPARAPALVALARLSGGPLGRPEQAAELYRSALTEDPHETDALEALAAHARQHGQWPLLADLQERRFELGAPEGRIGVALEAGRLHLEQLDNPEAAHVWLKRAHALAPQEPEVHELLADLARERNDDDALMRHLEGAITLRGDASPVSQLLEAASLCSDRRDDAAALGHLQRAHARAPDDALVFEALSDTLTRLGRDEELVDLLERRADRAGSDAAARAGALSELGALHDERGDAEAARAAYERAFSASPAAPGVAAALEQLYRRANAGAALRVHLEAAGRAGPLAERAGYLARLGDLLSAEDSVPEEAMRVYEAALDIDATSVTAHAGLQRLAALRGDRAAVLEAFEREASSTSDRGRLGVLVPKLTRGLEAAGRAEDGLAWARRWAASAPENPDALAECARMHERLGQEPELRGALEQLDALLAGEARAANRRRLAALHAAAGRGDAAIQAYRSALEVQPGDVEALEGLCEQLSRAERLEELAQAQRSLADLLPPPRRARCLDDLVTLLAERLGDASGAIDTLRRLAGEEGAPADVEERLANLLARSGRFEELTRLLAERVALLPAGSPEACDLELERARVLLDDLGRFAEAAGAYRRALEWDPDSRSACEGLEQALRGVGDPRALEAFLAERSQRAPEPGERERCALERASLLDRDLGAVDAARAVYAQLAGTAGDPLVRSQASEQLIALLERIGAWDALREQLESSLAGLSPELAPSVHERLARLQRDRLGDPEAAVEHFEAAARLAPDRASLWRELADLFEKADRSGDLARAIESELATRPDRERELTLRSRAADLCASRLGDVERARHHAERVLELDGTQPTAFEFLIDLAEREGRPDVLTQLLEARLAALGAMPADGTTRASQRTSLRLRIAGVRARQLDDLEGAIAALEPAVDEIGPETIVAEPLADLYQRAGYRDELVALSQRAAEVSREPAERANWYMRLGDALREAERLDEAVDAYRRVLSDRPSDVDAQAILRDLHRRLEQPEPLARLLELAIARLAGPEEISARLELAGLLAERLDRPGEALLHLRRVLRVGGPNPLALSYALELADRVDEAPLALELVDEALTQPCAPAARAALLGRRGDLLAKALARPDEGVQAYREALKLDPALPLRPALRATLVSLGRGDEALTSLLDELNRADRDARADLLEQGAALAWEQGDPEQALPWLERLRRERPGDPRVFARISEAHRRSARPEALVRALQEEAAVTPEPERRRQLLRERAQILEVEIGSPLRAIAALEAARQLDPDPAVLDALERLYRSLGRPRDQAAVIAARVEDLTPDAAVPLRCELAALYSGPLADPRAAAAQLLRAVAAVAPGSAIRAELLRALGDTLRQTGWTEAWARCAEAELRSLDVDAPVFADRRDQLHRELARVYEVDLCRPADALVHLRPLLDTADSSASSADRDAVEDALLRLLRSQGSWIELATRLAAHLERRPDTAAAPELWLELARLRAEKLRRPATAAVAFREVLAREPQCLPALRGLRASAERIGEWEEVARTLEDELEHPQRSAPLERAALYLRLGDVCWRQLQATTRASRAYAAALEANPEELAAVRALQNLLEAMEDWRGALDLYASEIEVLAEREPERRRAVWLRTGEIARDHTGEPERAVRAFQRAADLAPLALDQRWKLAELHRERGDLEAFAAVFESCCDDPLAEVSAAEHTRLAEVLVELGSEDTALARVERALALDDVHAPAWDLAARLHEARDRSAEAAGALARAAPLVSDVEAAGRLVRAAELVESDDRERACQFARDAVDRDPGSARAQAALARIAASGGDLAEAEAAARRALDLAPATRDLDRSTSLETGLIGGRAARAGDRAEAAAEFFEAALAIAPNHAEALAGAGEALASLGDLAAARRALEPRLALGDAYPERALHRSLVGRSLAAGGSDAEACEQLEAAVTEDPSLDDAHATLVELHERADRIDEGVACLERWADRAAEPGEFARRLLRAAEWELRRGDRPASAERHLRSVIDAAPEIERTWQALVELLWREERGEEAKDVAERALAAVGDPGVRASVALVLGRVCEQGGDPRAGAEAFGLAVEADPQCVEAALARARLLRGLGEWCAAAEALESFAERHPGDDPRALAGVLQHLGRLLAGPLEEVDRAVATYRRALELDPEAVETRAALAELLSYRPGDRSEALAHHRALLEADPTHLGSLRVLLRMAQVRRKPAAVSQGLRILRALGVPPPLDSETAASPQNPPIAGDSALARPLWEALRRLVHEGAEEIATALEASASTGAGTAEGIADPRTAFRAAALAAEGRLCAPALVPLPTAELAEVVRVLAALVLDPDQVRGDGGLVNALAAALNRRRSRRLRRTLGRVSLADVEAVDFEAWREEVRGLAAAVALDELGGDLRTALLTLVCESGDGPPSDLADGADLRPFVSACPEARALLRRVVRAWVDGL